MEITVLTKLNLMPFGNFDLNVNKKSEDKPTDIYIGETDIKHRKSYEISIEQKKHINKIMVDNGTDILIDYDREEFFTTINDRLVEIYHKQFGRHLIMLHKKFENHLRKI